MGICSLIGIPYGPVHTSLPFLLLGLGIDDIFVFMASWKKIHTNELILNRPLTERIGFALGHAGSAISVTSFTDVVAFIIGASTVRITLILECTKNAQFKLLYNLCLAHSMSSHALVRQSLFY